jgi:hypothetical protein
MTALAIASGIFAHLIVGAHLANNNLPKGVDAVIFLIAIFGVIFHWVSFIQWWLT